MRGLLVFTTAAFIVCGASASPSGQPKQSPVVAADYPRLVREYLSGNPGVAVVRVRSFDEVPLRDGLRMFMATGPSPQLLTAAAAMHAEAALRIGADISETAAARQLSIATGIVEIGMPGRVKHLGTTGLKVTVPIVPSFRRLFFITAIASLQYEARTATADAYLMNARLLFPDDAEVLLLSGIAEEMRGSGRLVPTAEKVRRAALEQAELYLREALQLAPENHETRLRLGRVLAQRGLHDEARRLLTPVAGESDPRLRYLASLFLGGLEDAAGHAGASLDWYDGAGAAMPRAQTARLAASELRHRAGARQDAADRAAAASGSSNADDPWWAYLFGEIWRIEPGLDHLREMART